MVSKKRVSKKRLILLTAGVASAVMFAALVPGSANAETNRRLCGAKVIQGDGKTVAYMAAKVSKDDTAACDEAINNKAPEFLEQQIRTGGVPGDTSIRNVRFIPCEEVFADLGFPPGTDDCPGIQVSPDPQNVFPVLLTRGDIVRDEDADLCAPNTDCL